MGDAQQKLRTPVMRMWGQPPERAGASASFSTTPNASRFLVGDKDRTSTPQDTMAYKFITQVYAGQITSGFIGLVFEIDGMLWKLKTISDYPYSMNCVRLYLQLHNVEHIYYKSTEINECDIVTVLHNDPLPELKLYCS